MMADHADDASQATELFLRAALTQAQQSRPTLPGVAGYCRNCDQQVAEGYFCDQDCRDDYQKLRRQHAFRNDQEPA